MSDLDVELAELVAPPVTCQRCGTAYPAHGDAGGPVTLRAGGWSSPAGAVPVTCPGFAWVAPAGSVGGYGDPPRWE